MKARCLCGKEYGLSGTKISLARGGTVDGTLKGMLLEYKGAPVLMQAAIENLACVRDQPGHGEFHRVFLVHDDGRPVHPNLEWRTIFTATAEDAVKLGEGERSSGLFRISRGCPEEFVSVPHHEIREMMPGDATFLLMKRGDDSWRQSYLADIRPHLTKVFEGLPDGAILVGAGRGYKGSMRQLAWRELRRLFGVLGGEYMDIHARNA